MHPGLVPRAGPETPKSRIISRSPAARHITLDLLPKIGGQAGLLPNLAHPDPGLLSLPPVLILKVILLREGVQHILLCIAYIPASGQDLLR